MREIKFRAWDKKHGKMSVSLLSLGDRWFDFVMDGKTYGVENLEWSERLMFMQYTGLKDKNGKEIYEGDVVRESDNDLVFAIEWDAECAMYKMPKAYDEEYTYSIGAIPTELKVVGNIYESPEL